MHGEYPSQPTPEEHSSDDELRLRIHRLAQRLERFSGSDDATDLLVALATLGAHKDRLKPVEAVDAIVDTFDVQRQQVAYIAELERALAERDEEAFAGRIIEVDTTPASVPETHPEDIRPVSEVISQYPDRVAIVGVEFLSQIAASLRLTLETIVVDDPEIRQIRAALKVLENLDVYLNS